jgi:hypothetical protein
MAKDCCERIVRHPTADINEVLHNFDNFKFFDIRGENIPESQHVHQNIMEVFTKRGRNGPKNKDIFSGDQNDFRNEESDCEDIQHTQSKKFVNHHTSTFKFQINATNCESCLEKIEQLYSNQIQDTLCYQC